MNPVNDPIRRYLADLRRALAGEFLFDRRIVAEARDHLTDAAERHEQQGMPRDEATAAAVAAFGSAALVAAAMAEGRFVVLHRIVVVAALALGAAIAWVDSRPTWDDTGVTAAALVSAAAVFGAIAPRRATTWGLLVGASIPGHAIVRTPSWSSVAICLVLGFPLAGAWLGRGARQLLHASTR